LLRGLDHYGRRSFEDNELAKSYYEQAIALDPDYARAYAALALAHSRDAVDGWDEDAPASLAHAAALVERARDLDPNVPQIYFVRGQIDLHRRDFSGAVRQAEHAIALSPSYADAHALLAWVLHFAGRPAEGLKAMQSAVRLNPQVPSIYRLVRGALRYAVDDATGAIDDLERGVAMNPTHQMLRLWLAAAYANVGRIEDARWQTDELLALNPGFTLNHIRERYPIRDPDYLNRFVTDLRKAGL
jgi:adenylate cyclase